jgi:Zn-dependent protease with chaperone function/Flp pilus assembly protein TadD
MRTTAPFAILIIAASAIWGLRTARGERPDSNETPNREWTAENSDSALTPANRGPIVSDDRPLKTDFPRTSEQYGKVPQGKFPDSSPRDEGAASLREIADEASEPIDPLTGIFKTARRAAPVLAGAWLVLAIFYVRVGWQQCREAQGTLVRLASVAAAMSLVALLPAWIWLAMLAYHADGTPDPTFALLISGVSALGSARFFPRPHRASNKPPLPLVDDAQIVADINKIAASMQISPPRVRLLATVGGALRVAAWVGGLPKPSLVITDGVVHRLSPVERNAIVAHEMAHIANHSLWMLAAILPVSCTAATIVGFSVPVGVSLAFGYAFFVGLKRIVSRPIEADCDRRAARAIGFAETISALHKMHALHPARNTGWISLIAYAWATHPSRDVRLSLLGRRASRESQTFDTAALMDESPRGFRLHKLFSWVGVAAWAAALVVSLGVAPNSPDAALWLLMCVGIAPGVALMFAVSAETKWAQRRLRVRSWRRRLTIVGAVLLFMAIAVVQAIFWPGLSDSPLAFFMLPGTIVAIAAIGVSRRARGIHRRIYDALQERQFSLALQVGRDNCRLVSKKPSLRHALAVVEAICGNREFAIAELESLRQSHPSFAAPLLALCWIYFDEGDAERALDVARAAVMRWPKDPLPLDLEARALRRLGRLDEAQAAVEHSLRLDHDRGTAHALAAGLALDRADDPSARLLIQRAVEFDPGGLLVLIVRAEIELATGTRDNAQQAVQEAAAAIRANPFALCDSDLVKLEQQMARVNEEIPAE